MGPMRHRIHVAGVALAIVTAAGGCARDLGASPDAEDSPEASRPGRSLPQLARPPASDPAVTGEVPEEIMARLLADAAERSGAAEDEIEVATAIQMTFSDGSLDCPEPGMLYTQALVDGYQVILEAAGEELDYRVTADGGFRLCENGRRPSG